MRPPGLHDLRRQPLRRNRRERQARRPVRRKRRCGTAGPGCRREAPLRVPTGTGKPLPKYPRRPVAAATIARLRAGNRHLRPLIARRAEPHLEIGPQHLRAIIHVGHDGAGHGSGRRHEEVVLRQPAHGAVVEDEAVLAQHQPVTGLADRQLQHGVAIEPVEKLRRVRLRKPRSCRASTHRRARHWRER